MLLKEAIWTWGDNAVLMQAQGLYGTNAPLWC